MENTNINIDQLLLTKSYNELTEAERLALKDSVQSERDFNDLKTMLIAATKELQSAEEIAPKSETKAFLMKEFARVHPATQSGAGGLGFLFPKDRAFYQKPGYQLIAVAAVVILIFTIYPNLTGGMTGDGDMAQHEVSEPTATTEEKSVEGETAEEIADEDTEVTVTDQEVLDQTLANNNQEVTDEVNKGFMALESPSDKSEGNVYADGVMMDATNELMADMEEEEIYPPIISEVEAPEEYDWASDNGGADDLAVAGNNTTENNAENDDLYYKESEANEVANAPVVAMDVATGGAEGKDLASAEESEAMETQTLMEVVSAKVEKSRVNKKSDLAPTVKTVKSLAENSELIDLFYTAM
jgi:hypothetical protein